MLSRFGRNALLVAMLAAALVSGCGPTPTTPSKPVAFSQSDLRLGTGRVNAFETT